MASHCINDLGCSVVIDKSFVRFTEKIGEVSSCPQPSNYRCTRERMDPAAVFPKVPACQRQMGGSVAKLNHEIGGSDDEFAIKLVDEIQVAIQFVMLPKSPKNQRCFVLLDRHQRPLFVSIPIRMPAGGDRS